MDKQETVRLSPELSPPAETHSVNLLIKATRTEVDSVEIRCSHLKQMETKWKINKITECPKEVIIREGFHQGSPSLPMILWGSWSCTVPDAS